MERSRSLYAREARKDEGRLKNGKGIRSRCELMREAHSATVLYSAPLVRLSQTYTIRQMESQNKNITKLNKRKRTHHEVGCNLHTNSYPIPKRHSLDLLFLRRFPSSHYHRPCWSSPGHPDPSGVPWMSWHVLLVLPSISMAAFLSPVRPL